MTKHITLSAFALILAACSRPPVADGPRVPPGGAGSEPGTPAEEGLPGGSDGAHPRTISAVPEKKAVALEQVFGDPQYQLTGVAISAKGRLFTNYPVWSPVHRYCLVEVLPNGEATPYPTEDMNSWKAGDDGIKKWVSVQAVYVDDQDKLWVVDPAAPFFGDVYKESNKLVRIDLTTNKIERVYRFNGVAGKKSYLNDVRVDTKRQFAYLTNSSEGGLVVVDLESGKARMLLKDTPVVVSDPAYHVMVDGRELSIDGKPLKVNSDGLALSPDREWLYYKPLTDDKLYRVKTEDLRDSKLSGPELLKRVEDLGHFAASDGIEFDRNGNLYLSDIEHNAIVKVTPMLEKSTWLHDERLLWPDSFSVSKDGYLYVSTSQVQTAPPFNGGQDKRTLPYGIFRMKLE